MYNLITDLGHARRRPTLEYTFYQGHPLVHVPLNALIREIVGMKRVRDQIRTRE